MFIGIDMGGTKLAAIGLDDDGRERARLRQPVPTSFEGVIDAVAGVVDRLAAAGVRAPSVGVSLPGIITRDGEISMIVNLPWLEGKPLRQALESRLGCPVALGNDANCFALSEATDGAGAGAEVVFGVILGTGVGGALVVRGEIVVGANATAGEWGHNPWPTPGDGGVPCACGRFAQGCVETWLNGAALARDYTALGGGQATAEAIGGAGGGGGDAGGGRHRPLCRTPGPGACGRHQPARPRRDRARRRPLGDRGALPPRARHLGYARERGPARHPARPRALWAGERPARRCAAPSQNKLKRVRPRRTRDRPRPRPAASAARPRRRRPEAGCRER